MSSWAPEERKWWPGPSDYPLIPRWCHRHSPAHAHFVFLFWQVFLEIVSEKSRYSLHQNMDKIKVPTQIIWGKQDQVCNASLRWSVLVTRASEEKRPWGRTTDYLWSELIAAVKKGGRHLCWVPVLTVGRVLGVERNNIWFGKRKGNFKSFFKSIFIKAM